MKTRYYYNVKLFLFLMLIFGCSNGSENFTEEVNVMIDFSVPVQANSMSGFLHGINEDMPEDSLISHLSPKLLRSGARFFNAYERKARIQAKQILVISGAWATGPGKNFQLMPYSNYELYKNFLNDLLDKVGNNVIFDVWNEPDVGHIWVGTQQQFFECFKITHDIIRERFGSDALISGPSTHFIPDYIHHFMNFCDTANIQLDILSYHELYEKDYPAVQRNLQYMRRQFLENPRFENVNIKEIHVNEYGYNGSQLDPSMILGYLYSLEQGKAGGACRACWNDSDNVSTCWNGTLGGLLTKDMRPRSAWWAHKLYAESIPNRVQSFSNAPFLANFAYFDSRNQPKARIILSNSSRDIVVGSLSVSIRNLTSQPFLKAKGNKVNIKVYEIPDTGESGLEGIVLKEENDYFIENGAVNISYDNVKPLTNYVLEISSE